MKVERSSHLRAVLAFNAYGRPVGVCCLLSVLGAFRQALVVVRLERGAVLDGVAGVVEGLVAALRLGDATPVFVLQE